MRTLKRDLKMRLADARRQDAKDFTQEVIRARQNDALMTFYNLRLTITEIDPWYGGQRSHDYILPVVPESAVAMQYGGREVRLRSKSPLFFTVHGYPKDWPENPKQDDTVPHDCHEIIGVKP